MNRPEYGKPETWPRVAEPVEWHTYHAIGTVRRIGILPRYEVSVPNPDVPGMSWLVVRWGYKRAQRVLSEGHR